jgi:hypothetical protein
VISDQGKKSGTRTKYLIQLIPKGILVLIFPIFLAEGAYKPLTGVKFQVYQAPVPVTAAASLYGSLAKSTSFHLKHHSHLHVMSII